MPKLQISLPEGEEAEHDLTEDTITVGRVSDNTIQIEDGSVSSHHAQLVLRGTDYSLVDLGSTNGTRLNSQEIPPEEERRLQDGDSIFFGKVETVYISETPAEQRPMPADEEPAAVAAESSVRPADFSNASPFPTKKKKKDPVATAVFALSAVAILAFLAAVAAIFSMKAPV